MGFAGVCLAAYSAGSIFGAMLGGELTHRYGGRATIATAMACAAPLVASITLVRDVPPVLVAVVALSGLSIQAYRPAAAVLMAELMPEEHKVMGFSMMRIALNIGAAVAPLLAALLIQVNWDLLFWLDGATAALWAWLAFVLLPKRTAPRPRAEAKSPALSARKVYGTLARDTRFLCYLVAGVFGMVVYAGSLAVLPLDIVDAGYPVGLYSTVLVISSVVLITCELKITTYIIRIPKYLAGLFGNLVSGTGFVLYALIAVHPFFVIAGAVLVVSGLMIHGPSTAAHPATFPVELRTRYIAAKETLSGAGRDHRPSAEPLPVELLRRPGLLGLLRATVRHRRLDAHLRPRAAPRRAAAARCRAAARHRTRSRGRASMTESAGVLLVIGSGLKPYREYLVASVHRSARAAGVGLVLLNNLRPTWQRAYFDEIVHTDVFDPGQMLAAARAVAGRHRIVGLMCWDEPVVLEAGELAAELGIPGLGVDGVRGCRDKNLTRTVLTAEGLVQPEFALTTTLDEARAAAARIGYPVVLKPRAMGASIGVVSAADESEVDGAFAVARGAAAVDQSRYGGGVIVEGHVSGPEISIDAAVHDGEYLPMFVARKQTGDPPYFEEVGHVVDAGDPLLHDPG